MKTCGEKLVEMLEAYGVEYVFGIPGTHTIELYRGLAGSRLKHISPRHEQGGGFMADGLARAGNNPAVCFTISGPGAFNLITPMSQALQDGIPMLVISADNNSHTLGLGGGRLHEVSDLSRAMSYCSRWSHLVTRPDELPQVIAHAFSIFRSQRPGPVHITLPLDVITAEATDLPTTAWPMPSRSAPDPSAISAAVSMLNQAKAPVVALGGGSVSATDSIRELVGRLDAPVTLTQNAKGVLASDHPLLVRGSPAFDAVRKLYDESDVVLAVGTEFGETDYDFFFNGQFSIDPGKIIRIDNDAGQLTRNVSARYPVLADAQLAVDALLQGVSSRNRDGASRAAAVSEELGKVANKAYDKFFQCLREALPDMIFVGDSTQPAYFAAGQYHPDLPRRFFCAATGFGTLGYALPAAMGARLADSRTPVVAVVGDGGFQYTLNELSASVEYDIPVIVIIWNNHKYDMIARNFHDAGLDPIACDPRHPDFMTLAAAYGCRGCVANTPAALQEALLSARDAGLTTLIEIEESEFLAA